MGIVNLGGRPLKFNDPDEFEKKVDAYFADRDKRKKPYTVSSLCVWLDCSADTLWHYDKCSRTSADPVIQSMIADTIKRAKQRILEYAEDHLYERQNVTGVIFSLKNNYGWADKMEITAETAQEKLTPDEIKKRIQTKKTGKGKE